MSKLVNKTAAAFLAITATLAVAAPPASQPSNVPAITGVRGASSIAPGSSGGSTTITRTTPGNQRNQPVKDPRVEAAAENAIDALLADLSRQSLRNDLTVGDLLSQTSSSAEFRAVLQKADRVGGVRWIDANLCQVRLRIAGREVQDALMHAASANGHPPITAAALRTAMTGWDRRSFSAVGTNAPRRDTTSGDGVTATQPARIVLPAVAPAWANQTIQAAGHGEPAASKLLAARAAEQAALGQLATQVSALPLIDKQTVGSARQADSAIDAAVNRSLLNAKASQINYHADGSVDVKMSLDLSAVWFELQSTDDSRGAAIRR